MPPANTPQITPPRSDTPSTRPEGPPPYTALSYTELPRPAQHVDPDNTQVVRTPVESPSRASMSATSSQEARRHRLLRDMDRMDRINSRRANNRAPTAPTAPSVPDAPVAPQPSAQEEGGDDDDDQRQRLQRVLARLSRRHDSVPSYSDRVPPPAQQSLYDWAPQQQDNDEEASQDDDQALEEILGALRRQHPSTHSDILEFLGRRQLHRQRESADEARARQRSQQLRAEPSAGERRNESLRSAAIMQNARTSVRSPSGTERMLRYLRNRERNGQRSDAERDDADDAEPLQSRSSTYNSNVPGLGSRYESNRLSWQTQQNTRVPDSAASREARRDNDVRARIDAYRRGYLAENPAPDRTSPSAPLSPFLENAVKYLDCLRDCSSYEDALSAAIDHGLALKQFFAENHEDFMTDTRHCFKPARSSLLQPGAMFEGTQNTASPRDVRDVRDGENSALRSVGLGSSIYTHDSPSTFDATRPWLSHNPSPPTMFRSSRNESASNPHRPLQDRWPVKVIVQAVDYEKMTVAGIMEAYDVPNTPNSVSTILASSSLSRYTAYAPPNWAEQQQQQQQQEQPPTSSKRAFPITTYLEGQIIDFSTHSFLTPSASQDAAHATSTAARRDNMNNHNTSSSSQGINFPPTSAVTDAANWRNLPPFNTMQSDEEVARTLLSRAAMHEIMSEWIFMRWKERCFIHSKTDSCQRHEHSSTSTSTSTSPSNPNSGSSGAGGHGGSTMPLGEGDDTDTGHGLTISGFYYVSLRRSDGRIEGLYFDTKTSPYQHLKLESRRSGLCGAWEFK